MPQFEGEISVDGKIHKITGEFNLNHEKSMKSLLQADAVADPVSTVAVSQKDQSDEISLYEQKMSEIVKGCLRRFDALSEAKKEYYREHNLN